MLCRPLQRHWLSSPQGQRLPGYLDFLCGFSGFGLQGGELIEVFTGVSDLIDALFGISKGVLELLEDIQGTSWLYVKFPDGSIYSHCSPQINLIVSPSYGCGRGNSLTTLVISIEFP